jgi:DNA-binding CsgD family transcriptional regulator
VAPVRLGADGFVTNARPAAIIFVHDPSARIDLEPATLQELYGLTAAEARIATLIARGRTVADICALLSVSANTVRTHIKRLLHKTETRTQSQLVQVLLISLARIARSTREGMPSSLPID